MASSKHYAYYIRGSQIALVQYNSSVGDGLNYTTGAADETDINDIGPSGNTAWTSPKETIVDGLEIEYAYSPRYSFDKGLDPGVNQFGYNAWTVIDGYLTLLASSADWDSSPYTAAAVGDDIVIAGSNRWNGLHKVQEVQNYTSTTHGGLKTYTKVNQKVAMYYEEDTTWGTNEIISLVAGFGNSFGMRETGGTFTGNDSISPYIWIAGSSESHFNNGLFTDWLYDDDSKLLVLQNATRIAISNHIIEESCALPGNTACLLPWSFTSDIDNAIYVYQAFRDEGAYIVTDPDILQDESDTIDLPEYLSKGLVYYVKSKIAEDRMDLEQKEYYMREFRRILEKHESSKIWGARQLGVGPHAIR